MPRLTIDELKQMRDRTAGPMARRAGIARARVTVHMGTCGIAAGARDVMAALLAEIERQELGDVVVAAAGCAGLCSREPMATVEVRAEAPVRYVGLTPASMARIVREHLRGGHAVMEHVLAAGYETTG